MVIGQIGARGRIELHPWFLGFLLGDNQNDVHVVRSSVLGAYLTHCMPIRSTSLTKGCLRRG